MRTPFVLTAAELPVVLPLISDGLILSSDLGGSVRSTGKDGDDESFVVFFKEGAEPE